MYCARSRALSTANPAIPAAAPITSFIAAAIRVPASWLMSWARSAISAIASRNSCPRWAPDGRLPPELESGCFESPDCADGTDPEGGNEGEEGVGLSTIGGACRSREQADTPVERLPESAIFALL